MDGNTPAPRKVSVPWALNGDQQVVSLDTSIFREGSMWNAQVGGSLYALCGNQTVMRYWSHNFAMDTNGNTLPRDDNGGCVVWCYCEDETVRYFAAPVGAKGTTPVFTQYAQYNNLTGLWTSGQIANLAATAKTYAAKGIVANTAAITTTETYITPAFSIGANTLVAGMTFKIRAYGACTTGTTSATSTVNIRLGTAGTTADTVIVSLALTGGLSGTSIPFHVEALVTIRTVGSSGTAVGDVLVTTSGTTGIASTSPVFGGTGASITINTTGQLYLGISLVASSAKASSVLYNANVEQLS